MSRTMGRILLNPSGAQALVLANRGSLGCPEADVQILQEIYRATENVDLAKYRRCFAGGEATYNPANFVAYAVFDDAKLGKKLRSSKDVVLSTADIVRMYTTYHAKVVDGRLFRMSNSHGDGDKHFEQLRQAGFLPPEPDDPYGLSEFLFSCLGTLVRIPVDQRKQIVKQDDCSIWILFDAPLLNLEADPNTPNAFHLKKTGVVVPKSLLAGKDPSQHVLAVHFGLAFAAVPIELAKRIATRQDHSKLVRNLIDQYGIVHEVDYYNVFDGNLVSWTIDRLLKLEGKE